MMINAHRFRESLDGSIRSHQSLSTARTVAFFWCGMAKRSETWMQFGCLFVIVLLLLFDLIQVTQQWAVRTGVFLHDD